MIAAAHVLADYPREGDEVTNMRPHGLWLIACAFGFAGSGVSAGTTTVYKCFDKTLGVLYTGQPCKGEQMDIRSGDADPVAVAELQREREALSRSAAQRIADNRRAPYDFVGPAYYGPTPDARYADADVYYPAGYGYIPNYQDNRRRRPDLKRPDRRERESFVPNPPRRMPPR
jgi:hypothetical protein